MVVAIVLWVAMQSLTGIAGEGMVVRSGTPLLEFPYSDAHVIRVLDKGEVIYIHDKYFNFKSYTDDNNYYLSVGRNGQRVWVAKDSVKLIYNDGRELSDNILLYPQNNESDSYSVAEPLSDTFPFVFYNNNRASAILGLGSAVATNYPYHSAIVEESSSRHTAWQFTYSRRRKKDRSHRFYYGLSFYYQASDYNASLADGGSSRETRSQTGIGPYISYDVFRSNKYSFTFAGSITSNYERHTVSQATNNGASDRRLFSGFSLTPRLSPFFSVRELLGGADLILGAEMQLNMSYSLDPGTGASAPHLWQSGDKDKISVPTGGNSVVIVGLRLSY